jgi:hypothetical protein
VSEHARIQRIPIERVANCPGLKFDLP